jgi:hypothetical protein
VQHPARMRRALASASLAVLFACTHTPIVSTTPITPHGGSGFSPPATLPVCPFGIGDSVIRGSGGAVVPERGKGVSGSFDGATSSGSIAIETSVDGIVTIKSSSTDHPETVEVCRLP